VEHRGHGKGRWSHLHPELTEKGGDDDQVARRRDRKELGEALDETP
jgi:hypothetical protein